MKDVVLTILEISILIGILLFISHTEIKPGFKIYLHTWWRGLGIFLIVLGFGIYIEGEKRKTKKDNYEKGYKEGIEDGFKKGSEKTFDLVRNQLSNKKESDGKNN